MIARVRKRHRTVMYRKYKLFMRKGYLVEPHPFFPFEGRVGEVEGPRPMGGFGASMGNEDAALRGADRGAFDLRIMCKRCGR